jgi:hypothetical protein
MKSPVYNMVDNKRQSIELAKHETNSSPHRISMDYEPHDDSINILHNKWYTEFNRLLYSKKCIYFYIFLIISSVLIFLYSLVAYFFNLGIYDI